MKHLFAILLSVIPLLAYTADYTWNGSSSSDWNTFSNWTPSTNYPGSTSGSPDTVSLTSIVTTPNPVMQAQNYYLLSITASASQGTTVISSSSGGLIVFQSNGGTDPSITMNSSSNNLTISAPIEMQGTLTINGENHLQISGDINATSNAYDLLLAGGPTKAVSIFGDITTLDGTVSVDTYTTFEGNNTYSGDTIITANNSLVANSTTALSPSSTFDVEGILLLQGNDNTINALSGSGTVANNSNLIATLTIANGASQTFSGVLQDRSTGTTTGTISVVLNGSSTLTLSGANTYSGTTTVGSNATLRANTTNTFSVNSAHTIGGTLDINNFPNKIKTLSGAGTVLTGGSSGVLTVNNGGTFSGGITGTGGLTLETNILTLSTATSANTYSGTTTVNSTALLTTANTNALSANSAHIINGDLALIYPNEIDALSGTGDVLFAEAGTATLTVNNGGTFSGVIRGPGDLILPGGTLTLSGNSLDITYSGATTLSNAAILSAGNTNIFSPNSAHTLSNTSSILLNSYNNTIHSIASGDSGTTLNLGSAILTINNGGMFSGGIIGTGGLILVADTLTVSTATSANTYSGTTTVNSTAVLTTDNTNAFSANSAHIINGVLNLSIYANEIDALSGTGSVLSTGGSGTLTVNNGGTFSGGIRGPGGLTLPGGTLTLSGNNPDTTYSGATTLSNAAILAAGGTNAFSPNSAHILSNTSSILLNSYNNTIHSIASGDSGTTLNLGSAILTINGGQSTTFAGTITNVDGGLTLSDGSTLILSNTNNDYSGPTTIVDGTLQIIANGALSPNTAITIGVNGVLSLIDPATANSAVSITNAGIVGTQEPLSLSSFYTQVASGSLNLDFDTVAPTGQILASETASLNGTLQLTNVGIAPTAGSYTLITSEDHGITGTFSSFVTSGFDPSFPPNLVYASNAVYISIPGCNNTWSEDGNGDWNDTNNWSGGCVPGINGNTHDVANFDSLTSPTISVTLTDGISPQPIDLHQIVFDSSTTQYTIQQDTAASTITLTADPPTPPQILVVAGNHTINAPIIMDLNSELNLSDNTQMTFGSDTTLTSVSNAVFILRQNADATEGTGTLVNRAVLTPFGFEMASATLNNQSLITPTNILSIIPPSGKEAIILQTTENGQIATTAASALITIGAAGTTNITNSATNGVIGATGANSSMSVGSDGTTIVSNSGVGALFGPSGSGSTMVVGSTGTTMIINNATFGPSDGSLTVTGSGTSINNDGLAALFGATGANNTVTINGGLITNTSGASIQAGAGGTLNITGGSIRNDVQSAVGTTEADIVFSGGILNTSGDLLALNYTQSGEAELQLVFTSISSNSSLLGNVAASGVVNAGGILTLDAQSISIPGNITVDLLTGALGRNGTYDTINYNNFAGVIPHIIYTPTAVQLTTVTAVTPTASVSIPQLLFTSVIGENALLQRALHTLHGKIKKTPKKQQETISAYLASNDLCEIVSDELTDQENVFSTRKSHTLAERVMEPELNPSRFYIGPVGSLGSFKTKNSVQTGFNFTTIGVLAGIDHAFETVGIGFAAEYEYVTGKTKQHEENFSINQLLGVTYATWVPKSAHSLAVDFLVGYGYDWIDLRRHTGLASSPVTALGKPQAMVADALLGIEYMFTKDQFQAMARGLIVTPFFNMQYLWARTSSYNEKGSGIHDLHVSKQNGQSLRSWLGLRLEYIVQRGSNFSFKPELDVSWQYEFLEQNRNTYFSTPNFPLENRITTQVLGAGHNTLLAGVDFLFTIYKVFELEISYDLQWNKLYLNNSFYLGVGGNF